MHPLLWIQFILQIGITLPIWFYLLYKILAAVQATDLMWFLYWVYVPVGLLVQVLSRLLDQATRDR